MITLPVGFRMGVDTNVDVPLRLSAQLLTSTLMRVNVAPTRQIHRKNIAAIQGNAVTLMHYEASNELPTTFCAVPTQWFTITNKSNCFPGLRAN